MKEKEGKNQDGSEEKKVSNKSERIWRRRAHKMEESERRKLFKLEKKDQVEQDRKKQEKRGEKNMFAVELDTTKCKRKRKMRRNILSEQTYLQNPVDKKIKNKKEQGLNSRKGNLKTLSENLNLRAKYRKHYLFRLSLFCQK